MQDLQGSANPPPSAVAERKKALAALSDKHSDMSWRDHLVKLLYFGAEIEHSLMIQYLYAAYSIEQDFASADLRVMTARWRSNILSVAREEMGHLLTVQNILVLLGAPVNFYRRDFPWTTDWYPFPPKLEKFSKTSLACYIYAEMPQHLHPSLSDHEPTQRDKQARLKLGKRPQRTFKAASKLEESKTVQAVLELIQSKFIVDQPQDAASAHREVVDRPQRVAKLSQAIDRLDALTHEIADNPHRVGALYEAIIKLMQNAKLVPDTCFDETTYLQQASWDEWGRGYKPDPYELDPGGNRVKDDKPRAGASSRDAHVMVARVATREQAVKALRELSSQGEAPHVGHGIQAEPSHFERFLEIYNDFKALDEASVVKNVPTNPTIRSEQERQERKPAQGDATSAVAKQSAKGGGAMTTIEADCSLRLAELFNLRYRMLLTYLTHVFQLARALPADRPNRRAMVMHRVFGEMYNLKALAELLMRLPLTNNETDKRRAGPPFEMPYSLILPPDEPNAWRTHHALLEQSRLLTQGVLDDAAKAPGGPLARQLAASGGSPYLKTLIDLDTRASAWVASVLASVA